MHRLFTVQELLQQIFEQFNTDFNVENLCFGISLATKNDGSKATLRNVALTCRMFKEPALDVLWWSMNDLTPLFSLLSGFRRLEDGETVIEGHISEADLALFFHYARKIRVYNFLSRHGIGPSSYIQVLEAGNCTSVLPSLKYFFCEVSLPEVHFLAPPTLRLFAALIDYQLEGDLPPTDLWAFVNSLPRRVVGLQELHLTYAMSENCVNSVCELPHLKRLHMSNHQLVENPKDISLSGFFRKLSSSSNATLTDLRIDDAFDFTNTPMPTTSVIALSALRNLEIFCSSNHVTKISQLFQNSKFPTLERLGILLPSTAEFGAREQASWRTFVAALAQATTPVFHSLAISDRHTTQRPKISISSVPELLQLHLTCFDMQMLSSPTPEEVTAMSQAWPSLGELELQDPITIDVLIHLAMSSPTLSYLTVRLDLRAARSIEDIPALNHSLSKLAISKVIGLQDPIYLASCVDRLFPKLQNFYLSLGGRIDVGNDPCDLVKKSLISLQRARMDQEERFTGTSNPAKKLVMVRSWY